MSAVTGHFERRGCRHAALFQSEYKRTNRTKKTKILRCFPHCCPEHLNRSYCGSSLCVRVTLVDPARLDAQQQAATTTVATTHPASLLVYAHFEEAQTHLLPLNGTIDVDDVAGSTQTEQTPKGTWIEGTVVRDTATTVATAVGQESCVFQINPGARWYYEWESAATKAQRFTKHALRVYIFQRIQSQLRVVGLISSSEFMVVSYRRAPSEVRAEREALEALRAVVSAQQGVAAADGDGYSAAHQAAPFERKFPVSRSREVAGREDALWQERKLWECRHPDIMTSSKHLAVLYCFLRHLSASSFVACLDQLSTLFRDQVPGYRAVDGKDADSQFAPALSWGFLESLGRVKSDSSRFDDGERDPLTELVHMCTNLAGWLALDSANLEIYRRFLRSYGSALLDKNRVRAGYVEAVKLMCKLVDRFTGWSEDPSSSSSTSLPLLTEEIMSAVFKYDKLKPLRRILLNVLSSTTMFGMHEFVAQLRAQYLLHQDLSTPRRDMPAWQDGSRASVFDGSWAFNGKRSSLTPIRGSSATDVSLGCMLTFVREMARMNVRPVDTQSLEMYSDWNVCSEPAGKATAASNNQSGMTLVLDSRQRVFSNFPSGLSSSIPSGAHSYGDYRGKLMSPRSFVVEMISWPLDSSGAHPALRWKLHLDVESGSGAAGSPRCIVVKAIVEEGFWRMDSGVRAPDFQAVPFGIKFEAVEGWYPTYEMTGVYERVG